MDKSSSEKSLKYLINTNDGPVNGYIDKREDGTYYKFKKIPYAKPPLGALRFRPPSPVTPWKEVLDCTQDADLPMYMVDNECHGSEDCLYIEISTKGICHDKPLPVMFWIGTHLFTNTIDMYLDPSLLNDHGVLFVRCGFRLGPFGFLSINEFTAPGNCGMKDLVMALKWVQKNIANFGGDPNNVTIFGSSTGGTAVHLLMMSPMASGLFHKAIIQNCGALNNWSLTKTPLLAVTELAKKLGICKVNSIEIVEELRSFSAEDIIRATSELQAELNNLNKCDNFCSFFKPCIEDDLEGLPAFLTKSPIILLKTGNFNKVPLIIGSNNNEGSVTAFVSNDYCTNFQKFIDDVSLIVPKPLAGDGKLTKEIGHKVLKFYLGDNCTINENTRSQHLQLINDFYFLYFMNKTVRLHSEFAPECPVFYYILNYAGEWSVPKELSSLCNLRNSAEIAFLYGIKTNPISDPKACKGSRNSEVTRSRVLKMWSNFSKFGNPTPDADDPLLQIEWDCVESKEKLNYLSIGTELTKGRNPFHERMRFWEDLYKDNSFTVISVYFNEIGIYW